MTLLASIGCIALLLPRTVNAHMIMNLPTPFNYHGGAKGAVQVNPLNAGSYPFPCQGRTDSYKSRTVLKAGTSQLVNFTGGAQHGGGSCQFSINYEDPLTVDARNWKTIYTIIGGCPLQRSVSSGNVEGAASDADLRADGSHCGNDHGTDCIRQFNIPIPKGLKNGKATFAWTWFNYIGNREMYMNCAPVEIAGGDDDSDFVDNLPQMFVANIAGQSIPGVPSPQETGMCVMRDEAIVNIPNPGKYGLVLETPKDFSSPVNGDCTLATTLPTFLNERPATTAQSVPTATIFLAGTEKTSLMSPASANQAQFWTAAEPSSSDPAPASSAPHLPTSSADTFVTRVTTGSVPAGDSPAPLSGSSLEGQKPQASPAATCYGEERACQGPGLLCFNETHFGICDNGCAFPQIVALGTQCKNDQIV